MGALLAAQGYVMVVGFGTNTFIARLLGPSQYGLYTLIFTVIGFVSIFSGFGFFSTIGVLLAEEDSFEVQKELLGAIFIIALVLGAIFSAIFLSLSDYFNSWFGQGVGKIIKCIWPLLILFPSRELMVQVGRGLSNVPLLTKVRVIIPTLFVILTGTIYYFSELSVTALSGAQLLSVFGAILILGYSLEPRFTHLRKSFRLILRRNLEYGLRIYSSYITANASQQLASMLIPLFVVVSELSYYKVASMIIAPVVLISQNIALRFFRGFAGQNRISIKISLANLSILLLESLCVLLFIDYIVVALFGKEYQQAAKLVKIMIIGGFFNGLYQLPDAFMNANSFGKFVLYSSLIMSITSVISCLVLIPRLGADGAAYTYVVSNITYFLMIYSFYRYVLSRKGIFCLDERGKRTYAVGR